jgi:hypothetical protein
MKWLASLGAPRIESSISACAVAPKLAAESSTQRAVVLVMCMGIPQKRAFDGGILPRNAQTRLAVREPTVAKDH